MYQKDGEKIKFNTLTYTKTCIINLAKIQLKYVGYYICVDKFIHLLLTLYIHNFFLSISNDRTFQF